MLGSEIFKGIFDLLDAKEQKMILRNIFSLYNVSIYSVFLRENKIVFRIYDSNVFYQYEFVFEQNGGSFLSFSDGPRFQHYLIYPFYYHSHSHSHYEYPYFNLVKLLLSTDVKEIISLFATFL